MTHKNILFIDTALQATCVGLSVNGDYYEDIVSQGRGHAERLLPMIQGLVKTAGASLQDLDCLLTTLGPGSFTGLRVGLSVVKTMQATLSVPVYGISTFDAIALSARCEDPYMVVLESKRADLYVQSFGENTSFLTPQTADAQTIIAALEQNPLITLTDDGCIKILNETQQKFQHRPCEIVNPKTIIDVFRNGNKPMLFTHSTIPVYLRDADVSLSKKTKRQLAKV